MSVKTFSSSVAVEVVAVLGFGIRVLRPNVGKLVLVELKHLLQRGEVA